jgi:hypothetical protein
LEASLNSPLGFSLDKIKGKPCWPKRAEKYSIQAEKAIKLLESLILIRVLLIVLQRNIIPQCTIDEILSYQTIILAYRLMKVKLCQHYNMKFMLTIIVFLVAYQFTTGQVGLIEDPDGWTNVREEPSSQSKILHILRENKVFWYDYEPTDAHQD